MNKTPQDIGTLHFVGIGGIGMSGIAEIMVSLGYTVQGSDLKRSANVERLTRKGVRTVIGHDEKNIVDENGDLPAAVVISSAVKADNPEVIAARTNNIPVVRRAEMLAELMRLKSAIAIGGTHGKTTTTAMVGHMMETAGFDPTVINGGIVNSYGTNTRLGQSEWMVVEADESDGTFTRLPAQIVVVTNMDAEHMEHYGSFENVRNAYRQFIHNIPFYGFAVLCTDHPEVQALVPTISDRRVITYGFNPQADIRGKNIRVCGAGSTFDVYFAPRAHESEGIILKDVYLPMLGRHNVQNALSVLAIAHEMKVAPPLMKKALEHFAGVKRRFTRTGQVNNITIIDDYAHHPVEIETVLKAARAAAKSTGGRVIAVKQPHRYTRLHDLFEGFCTCFNDADTVFITDVYTAGEPSIDGINRDTLIDGIRTHGHKDVRALESDSVLAQNIADLARPGDFVICMGAGDITAWAHALPESLEKELKTKQDNVA
jgi:UDP-N-acetylmuramate--alanine ligase